ncbi:MAG TPA: N-acetylmuramoyl-L-alanine amidase [Gaiellaceae bacterium]|nr:N-acetylmuramoyl-L-alanine amidase [Gaiellaceae bacterium]
MLRRTLLGALAALLLAPTAEAAPLVCLDPGHERRPDLSTEPIGPGSSIRKIKDGGGTAGEAVVVLRIARKTRVRLLRRGYRVAMTRTGPDFDYGNGGNVARAKFCNRRRAALMLRIHADGSTDSRAHGVSTLYPARRRGWTSDVYRPSRRAARIVHRRVVLRTRATDRGLVARRDLTGFNWADVPVILVETGFMTNPTERRRLRSAAYQRRVARGLAAGAAAFAPLR